MFKLQHDDCILYDSTFSFECKIYLYMRQTDTEYDITINIKYSNYTKI